MCAPMLGMVMGLVGSVVQGIGAAQQAQAQADAYEAQAKLHARQAKAERQKGAYEAQKNEDKGKRVLGSQRAAFAAAGLQLNQSTSIIDSVSDTSAEIDLDTQAIRYGAVTRSSNEKYEGKIAKMNASAARDAAKFAMISPIIGGISKIGGAFG